MRFGLALALVMLAPLVAAHDAPSGWAYPTYCCGGQDCRELDGHDVSEVPGGYVVNFDGKPFSVGHVETQPSPDGRFHACLMPGSLRLQCFFAPPTIY
jgi:hypothetical protein